MNIGIVGHEASKFSVTAEDEAFQIIRELLEPKDSRLVSGGCHLGGVDIWAEWIADEKGRAKIIHLPKSRSWSGGYKERNLLIARDSHEVHVIVVKSLPESYTGMRFNCCYHCGTTNHVKSGACWTAKQAQRLGKKAVWHEVGESRS